jgi:hypothetical protein
MSGRVIIRGRNANQKEREIDGDDQLFWLVSKRRGSQEVRRSDSKLARGAGDKPDPPD